MQQKIVIKLRVPCEKCSSKALVLAAAADGISIFFSSVHVSLLKRMATLYSFDCFVLSASSVDDAKHEIMLAWGDIGGSILYLVSDKEKEVFPILSNFGWLIIIHKLTRSYLLLRFCYELENFSNLAMGCAPNQ
ncbi:hypothetical protein CJ030_MR0G027296 [Morella rubra]|uniref:Uncharacterized protein n=1 Tax=Morella rubra TaxID=262757 RepID=A0A6A1UG24_9ROSI|nr:hypothetical protein CJ030_MR0G027296 [Morella rubra]